MAYTTGKDFTLTSASSYYTGTDFTLSNPGGSNSEIELIAGELIFEGEVLSISSPEPSIINLTAGGLEFTGNVLHAVSASLLGAIAYEVKVQGTQDWYYLTDELNTFDVDYYPYHVTDLKLDYVSTALTSNVPVDSVTFSILAGTHITLSYLNDFYFRIHIDPSSVDLGVVVSAQSYTINIWNAWFNSTTLNSATAVTLPDTELNFPYAIPYTFGALENVEFTVNIAEFGEPTIDGSYDFSFNDAYGIYSLTLQGQRAVIWPFPPLVEYNESRQWLTDIISAKSAEERYSIREIPRINLNYKFTFRDQTTYTKARALADKVTNYSMAMPYWKDARKVFNISATDAEIFVDTSFYEYSVDMIIMLFVSPDNYELLRISAVAANKLTLAQSVVGSYSSCWLVPVYTGWNENGIEFQLGENNSINCNVNFQGLKCYFDPTYWTPEVFYNSIPVFINPSVVTGGIVRNYKRDQETFDSITGSFYKFDMENYNRLGSTIRINAETREDMFLLKRQMDYLKGKYTTFWLPSYQSDITPITFIAPGGNSLQIVTDFWAAHPPEFVRVHGSITQEFEVSGVSDNLDGTSYIEFVETSTPGITNITKIEVMTKVRLNSDNIEFNYPDRTLTSVSIPVLETTT